MPPSIVSAPLTCCAQTCGQILHSQADKNSSAESIHPRAEHKYNLALAPQSHMKLPLMLRGTSARTLRLQHKT